MKLERRKKFDIKLHLGGYKKYRVQVVVLITSYPLNKNINRSRLNLLYFQEKAS